MGAPLLLLTVLGLLATAVIAAIAWKRGWTTLTRFSVGAALIWLGVYFALLLAFSLTSRERVLAWREPKEFCGFYLDCHLHAAVADVQRVKTIGTRTAQGAFYVVQVRVFSDARRATLGLLKPDARVADAHGHIYQRDAAAENEWAQEHGAAPPFERQVGPRDDSFTKALVFDVAADAPQPCLQLTEGYWIDHLLETFIIGDEDSLLHKRSKFNLAPPAVTARQE